MKEIIDIVNKEVTTLTNCEQEPIHIPGSIQENGVLFAINAKTGVIDFCSKNVEEIFGLSPLQVLGQACADLFSPLFWEKLVEAARVSDNFFFDPILLRFEQVRFMVRVHQSGNYIIAEMEEEFPSTYESSEFYQHFFNYSRELQRAANLKELCQYVAGQIKEQTGYDRVMIYRFDKDYNGEVFAEALVDHLEPFFGLNYPHTDIPPQARELYIRNPLRIITDVNYHPVPLLTIDDGKKSAKDLDLSLSILRSSSPIHMEYLQNMGVGATLTISLLKNGKLWGLVACHHYSAKKLPHHLRNLALLQGMFLASQITVRETEESHVITSNAQLYLSQLMVSLYGRNDQVISKIFETDDILKICNAAGVVVYSKGRVYRHGLTPSEIEIVPLFRHLCRNHVEGTVVTDHLVEELKEAEQYADKAAGCIYCNFDPQTAEGICWLRPERQRTVSWAGNPEKSLEKDPVSHRLSPRKSFELWKQNVKFYSADWLPAEVDAARAFAAALQKQLHLQYLADEEEKQRQMSIRLKKANDELENINWISTHDLKEPLRKIQVFSSRLLESDQVGSEMVVESLKRINHSAARMQTLIEDIMIYSRMKLSTNADELVDMNQLMKEVRAELQEDILERDVELIIPDNIPSIRGVSFQLRQLFMNIFGNSIKFSKKDRKLQVKMTWEHKEAKEIEDLEAGDCEQWLHLRIEDNGMGFDNQYATKIFDVFQRLHNADIKGTGIGLAICKKIMETHGGFIRASGKVDEYAFFDLYFPVKTDE